MIFKAKFVLDHMNLPNRNNGREERTCHFPIEGLLNALNFTTANNNFSKVLSGEVATLSPTFKWSGKQRTSILCMEFGIIGMFLS